MILKNLQHLLLIWIKIIDVMSVNEKSEIGYFLDVDLEYPDELHELHNDYPLASEKLADMLSKYYKKNF